MIYRSASESLLIQDFREVADLVSILTYQLQLRLLVILGGDFEGSGAE